MSRQGHIDNLLAQVKNLKFDLYLQKRELREKCRHLSKENRLLQITLFETKKKNLKTELALAVIKHKYLELLKEFQEKQKGDLNG